MNRMKIFSIKTFASMALMVVVLIAMSSTALAAPNPNTVSLEVTATPPAPVVGIVQTITIKTDANNVTTVEVTLLDQNNVIQTVTISLDEALALGLVTLDANNVPIVNTAMIGQSVTVQPPTPTTEPMQNPVGALIASFFGLDPSIVNGFHEEGSGYGVITQACWMSYELKGDASLCSDILAAKKSGDYSALGLPDGTTATNWGQFKKVVSENKGKMHNLGVIVSGRADPLATTIPTISPLPKSSGAQFTVNGNRDHGKGNNKSHVKGNSNGKGSHK
jgi:hypothetical protein